MKLDKTRFEYFFFSPRNATFQKSIQKSLSLYGGLLDLYTFLDIFTTYNFGIVCIVSEYFFLKMLNKNKRT